jgi:hypothetical protein
MRYCAAGIHIGAWKKKSRCREDEMAPDRNRGRSAATVSTGCSKFTVRHSWSRVLLGPAAAPLDPDPFKFGSVRKSDLATAIQETAMILGRDGPYWLRWGSECVADLDEEIGLFQSVVSGKQRIWAKSLGAFDGFVDGDDESRVNRPSGPSRLV